MSTPRKSQHDHISYRGEVDGAGQRRSHDDLFSRVDRKYIRWQLFWMTVFAVLLGISLMFIVISMMNGDHESAVVSTIVAALFGVVIIGTIDEIMTIHRNARQEAAYYRHNLERLTRERAARTVAGETAEAYRNRASAVIIPHRGRVR